MRLFDGDGCSQRPLSAARDPLPADEPTSDSVRHRNCVVFGSVKLCRDITLCSHDSLANPPSHILICSRVRHSAFCKPPDASTHAMTRRLNLCSLI